MGEWQPIETAPNKHGARFLAGKAGRWVCEAYWTKEEGHVGIYMANTHWTDATDGQITDATHWMPLPEPPKREESGRNDAEARK